MAALRTAEIEALVTVNTNDVTRADKEIKATGERIEKNPIKVGADAKGALGSMDRVESAAKKLVSERAVIKLDADITRTEKQLERAVDKLEDLQVRAEGGLDVTADVKRAEASIQRLERSLDGLRKARNVVDVDVDPEPAESNLRRFLSLFRRETDEAGTKGGQALTDGLDRATRGAGERVGRVIGGDIEGTLVSALAAIPIAGGIVLGGVAIGKAIAGGIQEGLGQEVARDRLQALTGISEVDAARLARLAAEAYTNNFGESIEANMQTSRLALQFGILDPEQSNRDAQRTIQGLAGIADVLGEDVRPVASAVATLLRTGLARDTQNAYDLIAAGARNGLNRNEDLLDTLNEYPVVLKRLGLDGSDALGLINQGLIAGARNSDVVADALKEFQIRATDSSEASAKGFERLGLNAEEMTAKIARGGEDARDGLDIVLRKLRETEDPVQRNAVAVELFGTKAEDLGDSLFALDLSSAVDQLDGVTGAAERMFSTIADNDASRVQQAQRNIEVAAAGIQGALAAAFSEPLGDFATWVSQNRGPLLQFFVDLLNGALDFAEGAAEGTAEFVSGPLADMAEGIVSLLKLANFDPFKDWSDLEGVIADMRGFDDSMGGVRDRISDARARLSEFAEPQVAMGYLNDASLRLADSIGRIGSEQGTLNDQVRGSVEALWEEMQAARDAGESQDELRARVAEGTDALLLQATQAGLTREEAERLAAQYGAMPEMVNTTVDANTDPAWAKLNALRAGMDSIAAGATIGVALGEANYVPPRVGGGTFANGAVVEFMAQGGLRGLSPMAPLAQMVPPSTWRVVGDRSDVPELYAPLDGSARSWALLMEGLRRMPGVMPMGSGGLVGSSGSASESPSVAMGDLIVYGQGMAPAELRALVIDTIREEINKRFSRGGMG